MLGHRVVSTMREVPVTGSYFFMEDGVLSVTAPQSGPIILPISARHGYHVGHDSIVGDNLRVGQDLSRNSMILVLETLLSSVMHFLPHLLPNENSHLTDVL